MNDRMQDKRGRLVRTQSILYVLANINNFIWFILFNPLVKMSIENEQMHDYGSIVFVFGIILFLLMPMHGFFNFCIYCYPRIQRIKKHCPDKSWRWCLRLLYTKDQGESEVRARRLLQMQQRSQGNLFEMSSGGFSLSGAFEQPTQQPQQQLDTSKTNDDIPELSDTQSFHNSGELTLSF